MFKGILKSEMIRFLNLKKILLVCVVFVLVLLAGEYDYASAAYRVGAEHSNGIVEILEDALMFDKFKIVMVMLLTSVYAGSFCVDDNTHYLRLVLSRTDLVSYVQAKYIVNTVGSIILSIVCFLVATLCLLPFFNLASEEVGGQFYYEDLVRDFPLIYILLMGLQFGLLVGAFGSLGLLFSAFQPDAFVSIGISGLAFYLSVSYIPADSVFDVWDVMSLVQSVSKSCDGSRAVSLTWSLLYPMMVIYISGYFFYRRMKWRCVNENI